MKRITFSTIIVLTFLATLTSRSQTVSTIAGPGINIDDALTWIPGRYLLGSNFEGSAVFKLTLSGDLSVYADGFNTPNGQALDTAGNLFLADFLGNRVYKITPDSVITTFIPNITRPSGLIRDPLSDTLYVTRFTSNAIDKIAPDGTVIPFVSGNGLNGPVGLTFDDNGNLYAGNYNDGEVYKITSDGTITFVGDVPGQPLGFIIYANGDLYGTSWGSHRIYRVSLNGDVTLFAGSGTPGLLDGPALSAQFNIPNGITTNTTQDTLFISDWGSKSVRMITDFVTSVDKDQAQIPTETRLEQNFPNPFNPSTTIEFSLPRAGYVRLQVVNILGEVVATLVNVELNVGTYTTQWNASGVASGLYFYRLQAGDFIDTKKLLLLK